MEDKCVCCGAVIPEGSHCCPNCMVNSIKPVAKYAPGSLVKVTMETKGYAYYNYVVDSYYNEEVGMHMYRLQELMAMPVWREDWLELVSDDEIEQLNSSGLLRHGKHGGFEHQIIKQEAAANG